MACAPELEAVAAEIRGIVLAIEAAGGGSAAFAGLDDRRRGACEQAWRDLDRLGPGRPRQLEAWRAQAVAGIADDLARLHPSWRREALAGQPAHIAAAMAARAPRARLLDRLAFGHLLPLCQAPPGPLSARLCQLEADALLAEIARRGARLLGRSLAGGPPALRARAMAAVGAPWAAEIAAAVGERLAPAERAAVAAAVAEADARPGLPVHERMLFLGLAALAVELEAEGRAALASVAGRLPAALGARLLGW